MLRLLTAAYDPDAGRNAASISRRVLTAMSVLSQATSLHLRALALGNIALDQLAGKILVDSTVPLIPSKVGTVQLPEGGSAVAAIQQLAGEGVRVVSAFQSASAQHLGELDHPVDCAVLICGNDRTACEVVIGLCSDMAMPGLYAGTIANSAAEALTFVLIAINRRYKVAGAGIRITGIDS